MTHTFQPGRSVSTKQAVERSGGDAVGLVWIGFPPTQRGDHLGGEDGGRLPDHKAHQMAVVGVAVDQAPGVLLADGATFLEVDRRDIDFGVVMQFHSTLQRTPSRSVLAGPHADDPDRRAVVVMRVVVDDFEVPPVGEQAVDPPVRAPAVDLPVGVTLADRPPGFPETLPPAQTETGAWGFATHSEGVWLEHFSFPIPLAQQLTPADVHLIIYADNGDPNNPIPGMELNESGEEVTQTDCLGSHEKPSALPGNFCMYLSATSKKQFEESGVKFSGIGDTNNGSPSSAFGLIATFFVSSPEAGPFGASASGEWAVTGP